MIRVAIILTTTLDHIHNRTHANANMRPYIQTHPYADTYAPEGPHPNPCTQARTRARHTQPSTLLPMHTNTHTRTAHTTLNPSMSTYDKNCS